METWQCADEAAQSNSECIWGKKNQVHANTSVHNETSYYVARVTVRPRYIQHRRPGLAPQCSHDALPSGCTGATPGNG